MAARKTKAKPKQAESDRQMIVQAEKGETQAQSMSRVMLAPFLRHGIVANGIADKMIGKLPGEPRFDDYAQTIKVRTDKAAQGDPCSIWATTWTHRNATCALP